MFCVVSSTCWGRSLACSGLLTGTGCESCRNYQGSQFEFTTFLNWLVPPFNHNVAWFESSIALFEHSSATMQNASVQCMYEMPERMRAPRYRYRRWPMVEHECSECSALAEAYIDIRTRWVQFINKNTCPSPVAERSMLHARLHSQSFDRATAARRIVQQRDQRDNLSFSFRFQSSTA
jgi:hypothetical protein